MAPSLIDLPHRIPMIPPSGSGSKSATGLMEWSEPDGAMDAFVMANHQTIYSSSKSSETLN